MTWRQVQLYLNRADQWQGNAPVVNPPSGIGLIGDTLTRQGGSTAAKDAIIAAGADAAQVTVDAADGRTISGASSVISSWRAGGFDPETFVIALGSFDLASTDAQWTTAIGTVLDTIASGTGTYTVQWIGISLRDSATDTRATRFMSVLNTFASSSARPNIVFAPLDWNAYIHDGDQAGLWDAADTNQRLMTSAGYGWRNDYVGAYANNRTPPARPDAPPPPPPPPPPGSWVWESTAVEGGGFQNAIAVSPFVTSAGVRPYIIGADVSGAHRSIDRGATWVPCNVGSLSSSARVAGILWSDLTPGKVFLAEDGGVHRSTDYGATWTKRTAVPDWDANNKQAENTAWSEHPRQTGFVLAQDTSGATKHYWAGTLTQGLMRSTDEYGTFAATTAMGPIRSIALDPNDRDVMYVCVNRGTTAQNGFWRITNARGAMNATKMTTYPGTVVGTIANPVGPEEVIAVDENGTTRVYVAGHESGMFRYTPSTSTWLTINSGLTINGSAAYRTVCSDPNTPTTIYCGHYHPSSRKAIYRSTNSGVTWGQISAPVAGSIEVDYTVFGHDYESFLVDIPYHNFAQLGEWLTSMLAVDPDIPGRLLTTGRGGSWFGTLAGGVRRWQPALHGLMVTVNMAVEADELVDGRAIMGNMDYTSIFSNDGFETVAYMSHAGGAFSVGDAVAIDKSVTSGAGRIYVGSSPGKQNTGSGMVWSAAGTPARGNNSASWTNETGGAWSGDVIVIGVGETSGGVKVILASVQGPTNAGLWRKAGATWSKITGGPFPGGDMGAIRWRRGTPTVYALGNGLWRSNDAGATWTQILSGVSGTYGTYDGLVLDPSNVSKLYVSSGGTLRRVDNANTSTGTGATTVVNIWVGQAGNVAINPTGSELFLNIRDGRIMRSTAFRTAASQAAANWANIASAPVQNSTGNIRSMTCTPGGVVITADNGSGAWRGYRAP